MSKNNENLLAAQGCDGGGGCGCGCDGSCGCGASPRSSSDKEKIAELEEARARIDRQLAELRR
ncbi:hypothetical protein [Pseudonocardia nigra]|uniref:hypothetical protein n=1 Tax=Pseudonocardia nigra TaxID=1921578 RepID=UPI001C607E4A|nr:hypothetical protein [Pseudonocardia nigra]